VSADAIQLTSNVLGAPEAAQMFLSVESEIRARVKAAILGSSKATQDTAKAHAPVGKTGALRNSISVVFHEDQRHMTASIAPRDVYYAAFLERGVVAYGGRRNKNAGLMWKRLKDGTLKQVSFRGGSKVRAARVAEGRAAGRYRVAPRPYMGPAALVLKQQVERLFGGSALLGSLTQSRG
jgi:hypothetical protein